MGLVQNGIKEKYDAANKFRIEKLVYMGESFKKKT